MNDCLISAIGLYRYYGGRCVVEGVSFEVRRGEILGFLGPNGAGKTTTMRMLTGNLAPSSGRIAITGVDLLERPKAAKKNLGYLPEQPPLYHELTVDEYLRFCARLNRLPRQTITSAVSHAKERCGLSAVGDKLIGNLSKGYRQRVGIAQAIIHAPPVIVLDEPTSGLDPIQIREIRALIRELADNHSVLLSTHILPEVQSLCDRVQIMHQGRIVASDAIGELTRRLERTSLLASFRHPPPQEQLRALPFVQEVSPIGDGRYRVHHAADGDPTEELVERSVIGHWGLYELIPQRPSLEEVFVQLTQSEHTTGEECAT